MHRWFGFGGRSRTRAYTVHVLGGVHVHGTVTYSKYIPYNMQMWSGPGLVAYQSHVLIITSVTKWVPPR